MTNIDETGVRAIEDITRRATQVDKSTSYADGQVPAVQVVKVRADEQVQVIDFGSWADHPLRATGVAEFSDWRTFAAYTAERADDATTLWAEDSRGVVTAVLNDHVQGFPGWRDHRTVLDLEFDDEWLAWRDGHSQHRVHERKHVSSPYLRLFTHQGFADFLEEHAVSVHKPQGDRGLPDAAKMLNVARSFQVRGNNSFTGAVRSQSGEVTVRFEPKENARGGEKGEIEVPSEFLLRLPVYKRGPMTTVRALFRWEMDRNSGELALGYKLLRVDEEERAAFDAVVAEVGNALGGGKDGETKASPWRINFGRPPSESGVDQKPQVYATGDRRGY